MTFAVEGIRRNIAAVTTETHKPAFWEVTEYWNMELSVLVTAALFISIYVFDNILFEAQNLTTFEFMYEGFGYMLCEGYCAYPFMPTLVTKYAFEHGIHWNLWQLVTVWVIYLPALIMMRLTNSQKHAFRNNPFSPSVARK